MELIKIKCDKCSKTTKVNSSLKKYMCNYCGEEIKIKQVTKKVPTKEKHKMKLIIITFIIIIILIFVILGVISIVKENSQNKIDEEIVEPTPELKEKTWQEDAYDKEVTAFMNTLKLYHTTSRYEAIQNRINTRFPKNLYYKKYVEEYEKLNLTEKTPQEIDFLSGFENLIYSIESIDISKEDIVSIYSYNYNLDGTVKESVLNNSKDLMGRGFFIVIKDENKIFNIKVDNPKEGGWTASKVYTFTHSIIWGQERFEKYRGKLVESGGTLKTGVDTPKTITYKLEDKEKYIVLLEEYKGFIEFNKEYYSINRKNQQSINQSVQAEEAEKAKPRPGMSAVEVRATKWGHPDKINRDTYSWGTTEQWVYNDHGYVYFKNGVVTSVSER